jgi:predicted permease
LVEKNVILSLSKDLSSFRSSGFSEIKWLEILRRAQDDKGRGITFPRRCGLLTLSMHEYLKILGSVLPLFLLIAAGATVRRLGILNEQADRTLLNLNLKLLYPCLILDRVMANEALRDWSNLLWSPVLGFVCTAGCFAVAVIAARVCRIKPDVRARTFAFTVGLFNFSYIPVPLVDALYGPEALGVLMLFNLGIEVAFWTVGMSVIEERSLLRDWRRVMTMPVRAVIIAVAINLGTAVFGLRLDEATLASLSWGWPVKIVFDTIHFMGVASIPIALMLIGATMADYWGKFRIAHGAGVMALSVFVRNFLCPLAFVLLAVFLPISRELRETLVVQAAMPAGMITLVLARHYGGDVPVSLQVIYATSAASIVTLPLWIHFGMQLIGVK